jgi:CopG family transcriptional regulator, nickel-responsive regulator
MPKIISVSLDEELLEEFDGTRRALGFSGRSEAVRYGINAILEEGKSRGALKGHVECVLLVLHRKMHEKHISRIKHRYDSVITTELHNSFCSGKYMAIFVLHGPADDAKNFLGDMRRVKGIEYANLIVP